MNIDPFRPSTRLGPASGSPADAPLRRWAPRRGIGAVGRHLAGLLLVLGATGCAASNYDFGALEEQPGEGRGLRLSRDLTLEATASGHDGLFDLDVIPLVHSRLSVFTEDTEERRPGGFVEADIEASLPLFGIVAATIDRYDAESRPYEHHEYHSWLWGLFQSHRERVDTRVGPREQLSTQLLWFLDWQGEPRYVETGGAGQGLVEGSGSTTPQAPSRTPGTGASFDWWPEPFKEPVGGARGPIGRGPAQES